MEHSSKGLFARMQSSAATPAVCNTLTDSAVLQGNFKLQIEEGEFTDSEIIVMLGENGTGKTTFIRMIHGSIDPDDPEDKEKIPQFNVSYKPQKISPKFPGSVSYCLTDTALPYLQSERIHYMVFQVTTASVSFVADTG